jgi:hypothetical protein
MSDYKYGIADNKLVAGILATLIATHVATITGFWYEIIHLPQVDWNLFNGWYLLPEASEASYFEKFITGWVFHSFTGLTLGLAFVFLLRPYIPLPYTREGNCLAAVGWGVVLALISMFILVPYLDPYNAHPGFMSLDLKLADNEGNLRPGWQTPLVILIWHTIWGIQLGSFYNPAPETAPVRETQLVGAPSTSAAAASAGGGGGGGS